MRRSASQVARRRQVAVGLDAVTQTFDFIADATVDDYFKGAYAAVDADKCDGCKMCVIVCPARVLELYRVNGRRKARTLPDITGKLHSLSDFRGKKVFLATWASW